TGVLQRGSRSTAADEPVIGEEHPRGNTGCRVQKIAYDDWAGRAKRAPVSPVRLRQNFKTDPDQLTSVDSLNAECMLIVVDGDKGRACFGGMHVDLQPHPRIVEEWDANR